MYCTPSVWRGKHAKHVLFPDSNTGKHVTKVKRGKTCTVPSVKHGMLSAGKHVLFPASSTRKRVTNVKRGKLCTVPGVKRGKPCD